MDVYEDIERCFQGGWSDGLPVIPPYGTLVDRMLDEMGWSATEVIGTLPEQFIDIRAEHLAAAAVMAGCKFEYGRLLRALSLACVDPNFNISPVQVTTGGVGVLVMVSGPSKLARCVTSPRKGPAKMVKGWPDCATKIPLTCQLPIHFDFCQRGTSQV